MYKKIHFLQNNFRLWTGNPDISKDAGYPIHYFSITVANEIKQNEDNNFTKFRCFQCAICRVLYVDTRFILAAS